MARKRRLEYAGAVYHVMARGDRREAIVTSDRDRELFLETLEEACGKTGWRLHAWVLMDNHYHWVVRTPQANLVAGMKWFQNAYTRRFNSRHKLWGHVFGGRYKSILVDGGTYLNGLVDYVHLNPVRTGLVRTSRPGDLLGYRWSSLSQGYALLPSRRPAWLETGERLGLGGQEEQARHRKSYLKLLHGIAHGEGRQAGKELPEDQTLHSTLERGWYWGSEAFRERLLKKLGRNREANANYRASAQAKAGQCQDAEKILAEGLKIAGLERKELQGLKGSHPAKVGLAIGLKASTTAGNGWIAERLGMKSAGNVSQQSRRYRLGEIQVPDALEAWIKSVKNA